MPTLFSRPPVRRVRRGAATVEFAVVAPLLFVLIMGMIEFGSIMMAGQLVTNAARSACRQGTLPGATTATVTTAVTNALSAGGVKSPTVTVKVNDVVADASTAKTGDKITVTVQVPLVENDWLPTPLFIKGGNASSTAVMLHE
jgi:Flp pilus assembly protein TadG